MNRRLLTALVGVALAACGSPAPTLLVDVRTDFVPGAEFFAVEAVATPTSGTPLQTQRVPALGSDDFIAGKRVSEWDSVTAGQYDITAHLLDASGAVLAQRRVRTQVSGPRAVTIILTRDCRDVSCPGAGDATATECFGGHCVPPECTDDNPDACVIDCSSDGDCAAPAGSCAVAHCIQGACLSAPDPTSCQSPDQYCDPDVGCRALAGGTDDAGMPMMDASAAGCRSNADCDDGVACTNDSCDAGSCTNTPDDTQCTDQSGGHCDATSGCAYSCTADSCTGGPCQDASCVDGACVMTDRCGSGQLCCDGACFSGTDCASARPCAGQPAGTVCRAAAGPCDVAETCDGTTDTCPADGFAGAGMECRAAAGPCDVAEMCDGTGAACPVDAVQPSSTTCRAAAGGCRRPRDLRRHADHVPERRLRPPRDALRQRQQLRRGGSLRVRLRGRRELHADQSVRGGSGELRRRLARLRRDRQPRRRRDGVPSVERALRPAGDVHGEQHELSERLVPTGLVRVPGVIRALRRGRDLHRSQRRMSERRLRLELDRVPPHLGSVRRRRDLHRSQRQLPRRRVRELGDALP